MNIHFCCSYSLSDKIRLHHPRILQPLLEHLPLVFIHADRYNMRAVFGMICGFFLHGKRLLSVTEFNAEP